MKDLAEPIATKPVPEKGGLETIVNSWQHKLDVEALDEAELHAALAQSVAEVYKRMDPEKLGRAIPKTGEVTKGPIGGGSESYMSYLQRNAFSQPEMEGAMIHPL